MNLARLPRWVHDNKVPSQVTDGHSKFCCIDPEHAEVAEQLLNAYDNIVLESGIRSDGNSLDKGSDKEEV